ncbi:TPA: hypothetical protein OZL95_003281 [Legionella pneumophila]|uniref:Transporter n=1 Tax=Legionella pneumophila TaxID=446 RepID=A0AAN5TBW4_LEGPN|nr:hypothetical protein [Legionella pneumophila]RYX49031.1 hypothetical protein D7274_12055 [Legionella pneumophila]HAT1864024.1 hypothetical protein [Legionella pneumophila]HAT7747161.1 hypothetical protein [Legionella pneumophila]HAT7759693.1 hypothetical protein [Legionella pneumophila]HAT8809440.1 hypothetical protein [Legionella pneumophila]
MQVKLIKNVIRTWGSLLSLILPLTLQAAAWIQPKEKGLVIGNAQQYTSCQYWTKQGELKHGPCFRQSSIYPYVEYGALSKLTLILSPNFNTFSQSGERVPFSLENVLFGGRYALWEKDWSVFSAQLTYNLPARTGSFGNPLTPSSAYALINRQHFIDVRVLYGTGGALDKKQNNTWYADIEGSYQANMSGAADEIHCNLMLGWKTWGGTLVFELQELNVFTLNNPRNFTFPNYNLVTLMPDIIYWYKPDKAAIQLGVSQDLYGTNIGKGTAPFVALWWRF